MQSSKRNGTPSVDHLQLSSGSNPGPPGSVQAPTYDPEPSPLLTSGSSFSPDVFQDVLYTTRAGRVGRTSDCKDRLVPVEFLKPLSE